MPILDPEEKRRYQREWVRRRRADYFKDKHCVQCESVADLELDHIEQEGKVSHRIWSWAEARRQKELEKCQVLCNTCHKKKTLDQLLKPICYKGHVKSVTGRDTDGKCSECRREKDRRYRRQGRKK